MAGYLLVIWISEIARALWALPCASAASAWAEAPGCGSACLGLKYWAAGCFDLDWI
jgi:hypothetical protein